MKPHDRVTETASTAPRAHAFASRILTQGICALCLSLASGLASNLDLGRLISECGHLDQ